MHESKVFFPDQAILELPREVPVGSVRLGGDHDARCVLVQTVYDAWPAETADAGKISATVEKTVYQGPRAVTRGRVYDEARRLVHHDENTVLIEDIKIDGLGFQLERLRRRNHKGHLITWLDFVAGLSNGKTVQRDHPILDQRLDPRSGQLGKTFGEKEIKPGVLLARTNITAALKRGFSNH